METPVTRRRRPQREGTDFFDGGRYTDGMITDGTIVVLKPSLAGQTAPEVHSCDGCGGEANVELGGSHFCVDCYYLQGSCCAGSCDTDRE